MNLNSFTTDELMAELMRRNRVLLHRVRATLNGEGIEPMILHHEATLIVEDAPEARILMEVMINGHWWGENWKPTNATPPKPQPETIYVDENRGWKKIGGIHRGEYD